VQQLKAVWSNLDPRKRVIAVGATVLMFLAVLGLSRMAASPNLALLYSGLEPNLAGDVVQALDARAVPYEIRNNAIYVPQSERDRLRLTLASQGLPANSSKGYELLDSLTGFGTTAQMFDAAYWRAKEGELARTISTSPHIKSARVHIAHNGGNPFQRNTSPTASVSVTTTSGTLSARQAKALEYLVASAVPALLPSDVAVIDDAGTLINGQDAAAQPDAQEALRARVERILEARVGPGNAIVELSIEHILQSESIRERKFDPDTRVVISTDTEETTRSEKNNEGAGVSVASNLPDGDAAGQGGSNSTNNQTRERVNYEVSETERRIERKAGAIKRLTVAVLVNGSPGADNTMAPRDDAELAALHDLVASAVGYDEARGDVVTIKSMVFDTSTPVGTPPISPGIWDQLGLDAMRLAQMGVLVLVSLGLGLFVLRPLLIASATSQAAARIEQRSLPQDVAESATASTEPPLLGEIGGDTPAASGRALVTRTSEMDGEQNPVERLKALIAERQSETVEILRSWLEEKEGEPR